MTSTISDSDWSKGTLVLFIAGVTLLYALGIFFVCLHIYVFAIAFFFSPSLLMPRIIAELLATIRAYRKARAQAKRAEMPPIIIGGVTSKSKSTSTSKSKSTSIKRKVPNTRSTAVSYHCPATPTKGEVMRELGLDYEKPTRAIVADNKGPVYVPHQKRDRVHQATKELLSQVEQCGHIRIKQNATVKGHHGNTLLKMVKSNLVRMGITTIKISKDGDDLIIFKKE